MSAGNQVWRSPRGLMRRRSSVDRHGHHLPRPPVLQAQVVDVLEGLVDLDLGVEQAAGVVEQLAHGDQVAVGQQPGQVPAHRVVQADPALGDQLEHDRGHERLGLAGHPEGLHRAGRLAGAQVADAADPSDGAAVVLDGADGPGRPGDDHSVQQPLKVEAEGAIST